MKKLLVLLFAIVCVFALASCNKEENPSDKDNDKDKDPGTVTVNSYAEFMAAEDGDDVVIEGYIQAVQTFVPAYGNITFYMADNDGSYYVYRAPSDQELADKLVPGAHVRVAGEKGEWAGEPEIKEGTGVVTVLEGTKTVNEALDASACVTSDDLRDFINKLVKIENAIVTKAPLYKWNGSGQKGDDLYIGFNVNGTDYTFLIETDLTGSTGALYEAGEALQVNDIVTIEGFMFWYDAPQMQLTKIEKTGAKTSYADFMEAEKGDDITLEGYIQAIQTFNPAYGNLTFYMADNDGSYFVYRAPGTQELADKLVPGTHVIVKSEKSEWAGEHETTEGVAEITILPDTKEVNEAVDASACVTSDDYAQFVNKLVKIENATVNGYPLYKWNGSGQKGDDLYISFSINSTVYTFVVETDLTGSTGELYEACEALLPGDQVNLVGFMFWYDAPQMQITGITVAPR